MLLNVHHDGVEKIETYAGGEHFMAGFPLDVSAMHPLLTLTRKVSHA